MQKYVIAAALALAGAAGPLQAQGLMGDVLAGKLVNPEPGVFAWYDLMDAATQRIFYVRQAVVGEEKAGRKKGYWVETEVVPQTGFPAVYKMLVTGPASEPGNVHRLIVREGRGPAQELPRPADSPREAAEATPRESLGKEKNSDAAGRNRGGTFRLDE